jgi:uncharacterized protein
MEGTMKTRNRIFAAAIAACAALGAAAAPGEPVKVVYHVNETGDQPLNALRNINNHLTADPQAKIVVVTHAGGIQFLLDGAKDKNGAPYEVAVQQLAAKGVQFRVCKFTLERNKIDPKKVIEEAKLVPSGVAEVSRLQAHEGFVYLKP